jgi:hypothetical protein
MSLDERQTVVRVLRNYFHVDEEIDVFKRLRSYARRQDIGVLTVLGVVSNTHRERLLGSESVRLYVNEHFSNRVFGKHELRLWLYVEEYNYALRVYGGDLTTLLLSHEHVCFLKKSAPDMFRNIVKPLYPDILAVQHLYEQDHLDGIDPLTFIAVRSYLITEDPHYLTEALDTDILLRKLVCLCVLEKVGNFFVPTEDDDQKQQKKLKLSRKAKQRDWKPSFGLLRKIGTVRTVADSYVPVVKMSSTMPAGSTVVGFDEDIVRKLGGVLYQNVENLTHAKHICFVVPYKHNALFLHSVKHYEFQNLTRVQGFARTLRTECEVGQHVEFSLVYMYEYE